MLIHHPSQILKYITSSKVAELGSDRVEVRLMSITIALMFLYQLGEPGTYALFIEDSMVHKVASTLYSPLGIGIMFYVTAAMLMPLIVMLLFMPSKLQCKLPRQLAALAGIVGAVLWGLMATRSMEIDVKWLTTVFALRAFVDLGLGLLFGLSLNAQHAKEAVEKLQKMGLQHADASTHDPG